MSFAAFDGADVSVGGADVDGRGRGRGAGCCGDGTCERGASDGRGGDVGAVDSSAPAACRVHRLLNCTASKSIVKHASRTKIACL